MASDELQLPEIDPNETPARRPAGGLATEVEEERREKFAADLEPVFDVPVSVQAVIGRTTMEVSEAKPQGL